MQFSVLLCRVGMMCWFLSIQSACEVGSIKQVPVLMSLLMLTLKFLMLAVNKIQGWAGSSYCTFDYDKENVGDLIFEDVW